MRSGDPPGTASPRRVLESSRPPPVERTDGGESAWERVGSTLNDRYELDELIATGGMGEVWRGRDTLLGRAVAVKVLRSEYTGDPTFLARFRAEATHAAALSHPNIAAVYDYGEVICEDDGEHLAYLVMELVQGEPLSDPAARARGRSAPRRRCRCCGRPRPPWPRPTTPGWSTATSSPATSWSRPASTVKITDFGIAWSAGSVPLTQADQVLGTAAVPLAGDGGRCARPPRPATSTPSAWSATSA